MNAVTREQSPLSNGLRIILTFHIVSAILWLVGQTGSVFFYDTVASWGLQEPRRDVDPALVQVNVAVALSDTFVLIPLHVMAAYGILKRAFYGIICSWMNFAVTLYWTTLFWTGMIVYAVGGVKNGHLDAITLAIVLLIIGMAIWGSWYQCRNKKLIEWWERDFADATRIRDDGTFSLGLKVLLAFHLLAAFYLVLGRTYAIFDIEVFNSWGLEDPADTQDPVLRYWDTNFALTDTIIQLPLHLLASYGILGHEFYGVICSWMALAATMYWPLLTVFSTLSFGWGGIEHKRIGPVGWVWAACLFGVAVWGSWYECRTKELIAWWRADFDYEEETTTNRAAPTEKDHLIIGKQRR